MPVKLEIFLDYQQQAEGILYLDDGVSFLYQTQSQYQLIKYRYEDSSLSLTWVSNYPMAASSLFITDIDIYGVDSIIPTQLIVNDVTAPSTSASFEYREALNQIAITNLMIPLSSTVSSDGITVTAMTLTQ